MNAMRNVKSGTKNARRCLAHTRKTHATHVFQRNTRPVLWLGDCACHNVKSLRSLLAHTRTNGQIQSNRCAHIIYKCAKRTLAHSIQQNWLSRTFRHSETSTRASERVAIWLTCADCKRRARLYHLRCAYNTLSHTNHIHRHILTFTCFSHSLVLMRFFFFTFSYSNGLKHSQTVVIGVRVSSIVSRIVTALDVSVWPAYETTPLLGQHTSIGVIKQKVHALFFRIKIKSRCVQSFS